MAVKLFTSALPKGAGGRKPTEIDQELYAAILDVLKANPTVDADGETRPQVVGDADRLFDTEGKASSDGRRYARPLAEALDKKVRVRVVDGPTKKVNGKDVKQYGWVVYVPMADTPQANTNGDS